MKKAREYRFGTMTKPLSPTFIKYGFVGLILDLDRRRHEEEPGRFLKRLSVVIHGNFAEALERFSMEHL